MSVIQRVLSVGCAFFLFLSLVMHLATFLDLAFPWAYLMVPVLFVLLPLIVWQWRRVPRRNLVLEIFGAIPRWMKITTALLFAYIAFSVVYCYGWLEGGIPLKLEDGRFVLQRGQAILRVLSEQEYLHALALQSRLLTAQLFAFYGLGMIALQAFYIKTGPAMADAKVSGP